jgi:hypothetical protein
MVRSCQGGVGGVLLLSEGGVILSSDEVEEWVDLSVRTGKLRKKNSDS